MKKLNRSNNLTKRIGTLFLLNLLLLNSVWASVHLAENDHQSHTIPHLHADQHIQHVHHSSFDDIYQSSWVDLEKVSSQDLPSNTEHDSEAHFHVHLHAYLVNSSAPGTIASTRHLPVSLERTFRSLTYTPPVPPPTA